MTFTISFDLLTACGIVVNCFLALFGCLISVITIVIRFGLIMVGLRLFLGLFTR